MFRLVPPAAAPLSLSQVFRACQATLSNHGSLECVPADCAKYLGVRHVIGCSSGRAALWLILRGLQRLRPQRSIVALPAYTCFSVPAAVIRAGLRVYPLDVDPETLELNSSEIEGLPEAELLCVVTGNLFGLANDVAGLLAAARSRGAFLVDDAAQALGASRDGRLAGTLADVGMYSLGRGKAIATLEGGLIVTDSDEIAEVIRDAAKNLSVPSRMHTAVLLAQLAAYSVLTRPRLYWIPNSLPFLKLGITEFAPDFPTEASPRPMHALLPSLLAQLDRVNANRRSNAALLRDAIAGSSRFTTPGIPPDCQATFIRFPVIAADEASRARVLKRFSEAGIGASPFYPTAICDIPGIEPHMARRDFHRPAAEDLARRLFTLPTHHLLEERDVRRMVEILSD